MTNGRLIVLSGPTAVGKGTVEQKLLADHPEIWVSVSATTRDPRPGEQDGVNYWFMTEDEFVAGERDGKFLETAVVHGMAHYGTPLEPVKEHLSRNVPTLLEIDLQGARRVRERATELGLDVVTVFIAPPSFEELKRRLIGRGTETAEQQAKRLETAKVEHRGQGRGRPVEGDRRGVRPERIARDRGVAEIRISVRSEVFPIPPFPTMCGKPAAVGSVLMADRVTCQVGRNH